MTVQVRLLGDIEIRVDDRVVKIGHQRQRSVLAVLLADANRPVPVDRLIDRVWADAPPQRASGAVYNYLSRLRGAFAATDEIRITRQPGGYALAVDPMAVDMHRFGHLISQARASDDDTLALRLFDQASELWQGEAFAGLDTPWLNTVREGLLRQRRSAELDRNDLALAHGLHTALLPDLIAGAAADPFDERLAGQLMLALYRGGRQADAIEHYQQLRQRLSDDHAGQPSPPLRRLNQQIKTADPALAVPTRTATTSPKTTKRQLAPQQLPPAPGSFAGRIGELAQLHSILPAPGERSINATVVAISGIAGVGKTALAVHAAHQLATDFPDGCLFLDLHGYTPSVAPVEPGQALERLLRALRVDGQEIPTNIDDQAALYRTHLAGKRVLILLDNARAADQVRPLIPASSGCLVLVTSRRRLTSLEQAQPLPLDVFPLADAVNLFANITGAGRITGHADALTRLVELCGRLPLAVRIAAARLRARPAWTVSYLANRIADQHAILDELDDGERGIAAAFTLSYRDLTVDQQRMFRLLGLHPGTDTDRYAAAALANLSAARASRLLEDLVDAHLLTQAVAGRYRFHDLVRAYAWHLTHTEDSSDEHRTALTGLFDHYLATATVAMDALHPAEQHRRPRTASADLPNPPAMDPAAALAWLDAERPNLVATCAHATAHGWPDHATHLAATLYRYLDLGGHHCDALAVHTNAERATGHTGDPAADACVLISLGSVYWRQGQSDKATRYHQQALALYREAGNHSGQALALNMLGLVHHQQGQYQQAASHYQQALTLHRETGERTGEARALLNLGGIHVEQGRHDQAAAHLQQALALFRQLGDRSGQAYALSRLGVIHHEQDRHDQAVDLQQQALAHLREIGDRIGEAHVLSRLGVIHHKQGHYDQALDLQQQALAHFHQIGDHRGEACTLNGLGETTHATGHTEHALTHHTAALSLARKTSNHHEQARAHIGLGHIHLANGEHHQARHQWQEALTLYTKLDSPEADTARIHLATLDHTVTDLVEAP